MMKKLVLATLAILVLLIIASCSSTSTANAEPQFSDNWWDNPPADTAEYHYEVGMAKGSTVQISREWAKANANQNLAQYISNTVDGIVTTYINDAGEVSQTSQNMQAMQAFESLSKQRAQATLTGVTYKFQSVENGTVYVLASLPIGPLAEQLKANVTEAYVKNEASAEANNMMNAAIDKYFN